MYNYNTHLFIFHVIMPEVPSFPVDQFIKTAVGQLCSNSRCSNAIVDEVSAVGF